MRSPGYSTKFAGVKQRVASKMAYTPSYVHPIGLASQSVPSYVHPLQGRPGATSSVTPAAAPSPGSAAPVAAPAPPGHDATYNAGIADVIQTRKSLTAKLASQFTNDNAGATISGNRAGLLHSSTLANKLAELKTNFQNDQGDIDAQYGTGDNYGIHGAGLLGEEEQRHAGDPQPTIVDNSTLASLNAPANAASPNSHVQLASGWSILYDASGKPVKFLPPGQKA